MNGYILLHKKVMNSDIWQKPPMYFKVFMYLLMRAQYQDYNGLERGQVLISIPEIQEACSYYVGYRKEIPTEDQIRRIVDYLRTPQRTPRMNTNPNAEANATTNATTNATMITTTRTTKGMVATICNYNVYQGLEFYERQSEDQSEDRNEHQSENQTEHQNERSHEYPHEPTDHKELKNKDINKYIYTSDFDDLWKLYPKKQGKIKAYKEFQRAIKCGVAYEEILDGVKRYAAYVAGKDPEYIKHGDTWFNQRGWEDEYDIKPKKLY